MTNSLPLQFFVSFRPRVRVNVYRTALLLIVLLFLRLPVQAEDRVSQIELGVVVSLTGPAAEQGRSWLSGVEFAVAELDAQGTPDAQRTKVKLIIEDDKTNASSAASAFTKLATVHSPTAVIGGTWDFLAEAIYPLAERYRTPFLTPTNPPEILSGAALKNQFIFLSGLTLSAEREAIEGFFRKHTPREVQIVSCQVPFCEHHAKLVEECAAGVTVHRVEYPMEDITGNLRQIALRTFQRPFDLLYFVGEYSTVDLMLRELQRMNRSPLFLTTAHLDEAYALSRDDARFRNAYGVYPRSDPEFDIRFEQHTGARP